MMFVEEKKDNVVFTYICKPLANNGGAIKKLHSIKVDNRVIKRNDFY